MLNRGVFLDRDGTINEEVCYLGNKEEFRLIDGAVEAVRLLNEGEFKVVIVTNQSGIARGYLSIKTLQRIHCMIKETMRSQNAHIDAIYWCPHHPTEGNEPYRVECGCRKPKPGMLIRAAKELSLDLGLSFIVGDKISDLEAGYAVGCKTILVRTGYGLEAEAALLDNEFYPDYIANDVLEASLWILEKIPR